MKIKFTIGLLCLVITNYAAEISGEITNHQGEPLSFSTITVKGTTIGTSANLLGEYMLQLNPGDYVIVCQRVGYKKIEKNIKVEKKDLILNFVLENQQYDLGNVTVKAGGEDPAYAIIREAIKKRPFYEKEIEEFTCEVYLKGQMQLRNYPKKFFGQKVDFEDGDTSKKKMVFLSESVSKYSFKAPNQKKVEVVSTRVSGSSDGFGFSFPQMISFYEKNIQIGRGLNPRGFISPIAENAFSLYKFKFEGSFFENDQMINRIKVIPKRSYEPLFSGYINIVEHEWRIHSVQLTLLKENQMQLVDTLVIEQMYVPTKDAWVLKSQVIYPSVKIFAFDAFGSFVQVYDKYNLQPSFSKKYFGNVIMKYLDSSNKKTTQYWDAIRPVPLLDIEERDYEKKDSLEQVRKDPNYLDSLDRKRNKLNLFALIMSGQSFSKQRYKTSVYVDPLLDALNFNTVEGAVINFSPTFIKRFSENGRKRLLISPDLRYGFSNKRFNASVNANYNFGTKYASSVSINVGRNIFQINNDNPVYVRSNTFSTLNWEKNMMKIYEASFIKLGYAKNVGHGFRFSASVNYQNRNPLENTTNHKWRSIEGIEFTPNYPTELVTQNFTNHQAFIASLNVTWQPGAKYIELPDRVLNTRSRYPTFNFLITQGIPNFLNSDIDYTKWRIGMSDNLNLKLFGSFSYRVYVGGFLNKKKVELPDMQHYIGNQFGTASPLLQSFQLMPYYTFSNTNKFYFQSHAEYHLNGFLTNKIPFVKKLNIFLVTGGNYLSVGKNKFYGEVFIGVENILKILRLDYVQAWTEKGQLSNGVKFSTPLFTGNSRTISIGF